MTLNDLSTWLSTFDTLTQQMLSNGDRQSLQVGAIMTTLRAVIAEAGGGSNIGLEELCLAANDLSLRAVSRLTRTAGQNSNQSTATYEEN